MYAYDIFGGTRLVDSPARAGPGESSGCAGVSGNAVVKADTGNGKRGPENPGKGPVTGHGDDRYLSTAAAA